MNTNQAVLTSAATVNVATGLAIAAHRAVDAYRDATAEATAVEGVLATAHRLATEVADKAAARLAAALDAETDAEMNAAVRYREHAAVEAALAEEEAYAAYRVARDAAPFDAAALVGQESYDAAAAAVRDDAWKVYGVAAAAAVAAANEAAATPDVDPA